MTAKTNKPLSILGLGAAICAACCAGPILGFIAATGLLTASGFAFFGAIGLLIAIPGIALARRRRPPALHVHGTEGTDHGRSTITSYLSARQIAQQEVARYATRFRWGAKRAGVVLAGRCLGGSAARSVLCG